MTSSKTYFIPKSIGPRTTEQIAVKNFVPSSSGVTRTSAAGGKCEKRRPPGPPREIWSPPSDDIYSYKPQEWLESPIIYNLYCISGHHLLSFISSNNDFAEKYDL